MWVRSVSAMSAFNVREEHFYFRRTHCRIYKIGYYSKHSCLRTAVANQRSHDRLCREELTYWAPCQVESNFFCQHRLPLKAVKLSKPLYPLCALWNSLLVKVFMSSGGTGFKAGIMYSSLLQQFSRCFRSSFHNIELQWWQTSVSYTHLTLPTIYSV